MFIISVGFFSKFIGQFQPLTKKCINEPGWKHLLLIESLRKLIQNQTQLSEEIHSQFLAFRVQAADFAHKCECTEEQKTLQSEITLLTTKIYFEQRDIVGKGYQTVLNMLSLLEDFLKQHGAVETQVDDLADTLDALNMEQDDASAMGAVGGAAASSLNIPEGQSGQGQQQDE